MVTVIIHVSNEDPVLGELDNLPSPIDNLVALKNPRKKDGKDIKTLESNVSILIYPIAKVNYIEVVSSESEEQIITFVRE
jgi:hypothetical protein